MHELLRWPLSGHYWIFGLLGLPEGDICTRHGLQELQGVCCWYVLFGGGSVLHWLRGGDFPDSVGTVFVLELLEGLVLGLCCIQGLR